MTGPWPEPTVGLVPAVVFLSEPLAWYHAVSIGLIFLGISLATRSR